MGAPSSASTMRRASADGKVDMPSCSLASSAMTGAGITSGRIDMIWPNLHKAQIGPLKSTC